MLTIDKFGRRPLLLVTFPIMSILLLFTGFCFWIPDREARVGCIALGIYLYCMAYSPGEGPGEVFFFFFEEGKKQQEYDTNQSNSALYVLCGGLPTLHS